MRAQRVMRPIRSIEEVLASLDTFGERIADRLDELRSPAAFSYRQVFDDHRRDLEELRRDVVGAEDEHLRRRIRAKALGRESDELGQELYEQQVAVRQILGGAYGPERGFELAAISGTTPRTLKPLEEQVDQTVKLLREPREEEPTVKVAGVQIDLDEVAGGLEAMLVEFRATRLALERARKAVVESKVLLDRALAGFQASFPWIARNLEAYARRAGERELAELVRTSIRRVTRRQAEEPPEEPAVGVAAPPAATPADETALSTATSADDLQATETRPAVETTSVAVAGRGRHPSPIRFPSPPTEPGSD